jgi:hypothetical protein
LWAVTGQVKMGLGFIFLDRVKYGFDRGWTFFHVGLGCFSFIWVGFRYGYSMGWGVGIQISKH